MKIKMPSGVILETEDYEIGEAWIANGGTVYVERAEAQKAEVASTETKRGRKPNNAENAE